jgi:hypothetical protein
MLKEIEIRGIWRKLHNEKFNNFCSTLFTNRGCDLCVGQDEPVYHTCIMYE